MSLTNQNTEDINVGWTTIYSKENVQVNLDSITTDIGLKAKRTTDSWEEYSFADSTQYDLTCAEQLRDVITTVNPMGLAQGRGDKSQ